MSLWFTTIGLATLLRGCIGTLAMDSEKRAPTLIKVRTRDELGATQRKRKN